MLEAHVRELPEHVVPQHEAAVVGGDDRPVRVVVDPEHVVGRAGVRAVARADPDRGEPPHARPHAWPSATAACADVDHRAQDVAGSRERPQGGDRVGRRRRRRREARACR